MSTRPKLRRRGDLNEYQKSQQHTRLHKEKMFASEFVVDMNPTAAARRVGYAVSTAKNKATELLQKKRVRKLIDKEMDKKLYRCDIRKDRVLLELARLGFSNITDIFDDEGQMLPMSKWSKDISAAVSSVEMATAINMQGIPYTYVKKIKLWDKNTAITNLGKHLEMFTEIKHTTNVVEVGDTLTEFFERVAEQGRRLTDPAPPRVPLVIDAEGAVDVDPG